MSASLLQTPTQSDVPSPGTDPGEPLPLLLLYARTGAGHRASARALAREIRASAGGRFVPHLLDPFAEASPALVRRIVDLYDPLTRRAPWLWGAGWHATDSRAAVRLLRAGFLRFVEPGLQAAMARLRPAGVVSLHPLLNDAAVRVVRRLPVPRPPVITVVTDLVDVHASWTCPDVDAVVTASPGGLDHCRRAGIPAERCIDLGLPVDGAFTVPPADDAERIRVRRRLGLTGSRPVVLLTGGGAGAGGLLRRTRALLEERLDLQVVVVCGNNSTLEQRLRSLPTPPPTTLRVLGFVDNMADWMRAADVVVTKAGPGTIAEALCSGTPLLLTSYLPGQERGNVAFVVDTGCGRWVPRVEAMVDAVRELSRPGSPALAAMRDALRHAARPTATARIAGLVCELAGRRVAR